MNTLSFKYIYNLFVQAAEDVPSWAPEWVKKHPHFEQYESLEDIVKSFPIKYYREPLIIEKRIIDNFEESIDEQRKDAIWDVVDGLYRIIVSYSEKVENATPQIDLLSSKILPLKLSLQENSRKIKDLEIKIDKCSEIIDFVDKNKNNWNEIAPSDLAEFSDQYKEIFGIKFSKEVFNFNMVGPVKIEASNVIIRSNEQKKQFLEIEKRYKDQLEIEERKIIDLSEEGKNLRTFLEKTYFFYKFLARAQPSVDKIYKIYLNNLKNGNTSMKDCFVIFDDLSMIFNVPTKVGIKPKKIFLPPGTSWMVVAKQFAEIPFKYFPHLFKPDEFEHTEMNADSAKEEYHNSIQKLKDLSSVKKINDAFVYLSTRSIEDTKTLQSLDKENFEIVFSARAADVLTMSTRSLWTSCQNFLYEGNVGYSKHAVNSAVSKYVAIIYATNSQDFRKRGEQMFARSVVFLLKHNKSKKPAVFIEKAYGPESNADYFFNEFKKSLEKTFSGLGIKVISSNDDYHNYSFPYEETGTPYFDTKTLRVEEDPDLHD